MLDPFDVDNLIHLKELDKELPGRVSYFSLVRWALVGRRGIKLETICLNGKRWTTKEAFREFINATSGTMRPAKKPALSARNTKRHAENRAAKAKLAKAGI